MNRATVMEEQVRIEKIMSGGQTGADRAALEFAIKQGIPHHGWCPRGRKAEDGLIPSRFKLKETPSAGYSQRTEWNARDSDGTVVFTVTDQLEGGSKKTILCARRFGKPWLHLAAKRPGADHAGLLRRFVERNQIKVLNVAGPRGSEAPAISKFVTSTLTVSVCRGPAGKANSSRLDCGRRTVSAEFIRGDPARLPG